MPQWFVKRQQIQLNPRITAPLCSCDGVFRLTAESQFCLWRGQPVYEFLSLHSSNEHERTTDGNGNCRQITSCKRQKEKGIEICGAETQIWRCVFCFITIL